ncbi:copper resistance protein CopC [Streptomyces sp. NPDC050504]|uniref:copper resistance protein CopC n=1 Tax=Streptomyces sp. NPDC050504 TaxID=3365618 RepID=UPI0037B75CFF
MRTRHTPAARAAVRPLLLPAAVTGLLAVSAPQAAAHTDLNGSDPANGAVLDALPRTVTLTFSDPVTQKHARLAVTGPDGAALGDGAPAVAGREVTLRLKDAKARGRYTVGYRVVSADGHSVAGTSAFTVRPPAATASQQPSPTSSLSPSAVASGERAVSSLKAIGIGFGLGLVGLVTAMVVTVRRHRNEGPA